MAHEEAIMGTLASALYAFDGVRDDNLNFKEGEVITIIEMNENGWWKGTNSKGEVGIFPYNYVQVRPEAAPSFPIVKALYDFPGGQEGQLSFKSGDLITVMKEIDAQWNEGKLKSGERGIYPTSFTEPTGEEDEDAAAEETKKWEEIEAAREAEVERLRKEKEEAEKKLREEEERLKKQKEEEERARLAAEAEQQRITLMKEAEAAKALANQLQKEKAETEAAIKKAQLELEKIKQQAEAERRAQELKLQQEAVEARRRAEMAERELEQARAEAAALRKKQEKKDARKSIDITNKIQLEKKELEELVQKTQEKNEFSNPKRAPKKKELAFKPVYVDEGEELPEKEPEPEPAEPEESAATNRRKQRRPAKKVNSKFAHLGRGGETCKVCGKAVGVASRVKALGNFYHKECFTCSTCSKILRQGDFVDHKGEPYCMKCHKKGFGPAGFGFGGAVASRDGGGKRTAATVVDTASMFTTGFTLPRDK
mmetsp:Transcript_16571/g.18756  ORF Transcript_16571/g.18756 Transcript_16571/m.18756 type:complete len:483 (-) Transcript_16571:966-2414(-)